MLSRQGSNGLSDATRKCKILLHMFFTTEGGLVCESTAGLYLPFFYCKPMRLQNQKVGCRTHPKLNEAEKTGIVIDVALAKYSISKFHVFRIGESMSFF